MKVPEPKNGQFCEHQDDTYLLSLKISFQQWHLCYVVSYTYLGLEPLQYDYIQKYDK